MMNWKVSGGKSSWPDLCIILIFVSRIAEKPPELSVSIVDVPAETPPEYEFKALPLNQAIRWKFLALPYTSTGRKGGPFCSSMQENDSRNNFLDIFSKNRNYKIDTFHWIETNYDTCL
jgi:hypothetical protein